MGGGGRCPGGVHRRVAGPYITRHCDSLAAFCRYWRMTPREVDELTNDEFDAFVRYQRAEIREQKRAMSRARRH